MLGSSRRVATALGRALVVAPVIGSPYASNVTNRTMPEVPPDGRETRWQLIIAATSDRMDKLQRVFPAATTYSTFLCCTFSARLS